MQADKSGELAKGVFTVIGATAVIVLVSLLPTLLWYCFDDRLSEVVGAPWVGELAWYHVWPVLMFWSLVFQPRQARTNSKS